MRAVRLFSYVCFFVFLHFFGWGWGECVFVVLGGEGRRAIFLKGGRCAFGCDIFWGECAKELLSSPCLRNVSQKPAWDEMGRVRFLFGSNFTLLKIKMEQTKPCCVEESPFN